MYESKGIDRRCYKKRTCTVSVILLRVSVLVRLFLLRDDVQNTYTNSVYKNSTRCFVFEDTRCFFCFLEVYDRTCTLDRDNTGTLCMVLFRTVTIRYTISTYSGTLLSVLLYSRQYVVFGVIFVF